MKTYRHECWGKIKHCQLCNLFHSLAVFPCRYSNLFHIFAIFLARLRKCSHRMCVSLDCTVGNDREHGRKLFNHRRVSNVIISNLYRVYCCRLWPTMSRQRLMSWSSASMRCRRLIASDFMPRSWLSTWENSQSGIWSSFLYFVCSSIVRSAVCIVVRTSHISFPNPESTLRSFTEVYLIFSSSLVSRLNFKEKAYSA